METYPPMDVPTRKIDDFDRFDFTWLMTSDRSLQDPRQSSFGV